MSRFPVALAMCAAFATASAAAQTLKPGLWEMQHKSSTHPQVGQGLAQMQQRLAALPPEQRKQVEAMLAGSGVQFGAAPGGGMSMRVCMTREMVERNEIPASQGDCRTTRSQRSGNTLTMAFTCTNPPSSGEGQVTFLSPESYASKTTVTSMVDGKPERMSFEGTGRWLSADCGNLRPPGGGR